MAIGDLRDQLRQEERGLLARYSDRVGSIERLRPIFVLLGVLGAFAAALSRLHDGTAGIVVAVVGAVFALVGGGVVALLDYRKLELGRETRDAHALAEAAILAAESRQQRVTEVEQTATRLDHKRRERLLAIERMIEAVEAGLLRGADAATVAEQLLKCSIASVRKAVDYESTDFFTVSVFRRETLDGAERMVRVAAQWTDPERAGRDGRSWKLGEGYTGVAWANARTNPRGDVIEPDTSLPHIPAQYPVANRDPDREALYLSVAAIPILIGRSNDVWGVVTATVDRRGVFQRDHANLTVQNVDMIRDIARIAALLAGLPARQADAKGRG